MRSSAISPKLTFAKLYVEIMKSQNLSGSIIMGKYDDIWTRVKEFEDAKKERKKKSREEKVKEVEGSTLKEEVVASETQELEAVPSLGSTIDCRIIKEYTPPLFVPETPNMTHNGAWKKYKERFGKYLAFIDSVKYIRSSKYCTILALATTSQWLINIWGSEKNVSNALKELKEIGLLKDYNEYYQTGMCKLYCYFYEVEKQLLEYCKENNIPKIVVGNQQILTPKQTKEYKKRCEEVYSDEFRKGVLFKSRLNLKRPASVKPKQFINDLYEMLYENYPGFKSYQSIAETINETYYKDQEEFHIRFKPKFHWNENPKKEKTKNQSAIVGIGIRASNKLCSAKKDDDFVDGETKKILREEVLAKYGFEFEKDITSSVPRVAYALNHGGWLKEEVDLYKKIYDEVSPDGSEEDFLLEREAIKKLFFRVYFDSTDNKLAFHTWNSMKQDGISRDSVYEDMINLRRAMEKVLGEKRYDNYIFYVESCIYIDTLHILLEQGYKVWLVYDCFYGTGFGTNEEFEKLVLEAVWVSFVRFKLACDFNEWGDILKVD